MKKLLLYSSGLILIILAGFAMSNYLSLKTLVVNFENIDSVAVFSSKNLDDKTGQKPIKTIRESGQTIKLKKGDYILQYDAKNNYRDYFASVNLHDKRQTVHLSPDYSDDYLNKILDGELGSIQGSILQKYPKVGQLYTIQRGKLYKKGEWYGTTLTYKGDVTGSNFFQTDTLRLVLEKLNDQWIVKTTPPNILLNKYAYPGVPEDVLRNVNSLPAGPAG